MDNPWNRWSTFLVRQGDDQADFGREAVIRFVSTFGTDVTAGSQKLHIAAVTTTYKMAFDFDLNDINGIRWDALFYVKKGQKKVKKGK